jgi:hypothetical protein
MLQQVAPGQITKPFGSQGVYRIIKVVSKEPAGQRDLNDPNVQQASDNDCSIRRTSCCVPRTMKWLGMRPR